MTRTERAVYPRAIIKDRSESKSGMDKSLRKGGAGAHNWGNLRDEVDLEEVDVEGEGPAEAAKTPAARTTGESGVGADGARRPSVSATSSTSSQAELEAEQEKAKNFRAHALKDASLDLGSIARTSAAASTSPQSTHRVLDTNTSK